MASKKKVLKIALYSALTIIIIFFGFLNYANLRILSKYKEPKHLYKDISNIIYELHFLKKHDLYFVNLKDNSELRLASVYFDKRNQEQRFFNYCFNCDRKFNYYKKFVKYYSEISIEKSLTVDNWITFSVKIDASKNSTKTAQQTIFLDLCNTMFVFGSRKADSISKLEFPLPRYLDSTKLFDKRIMYYQVYCDSMLPSLVEKLSLDTTKRNVIKKVYFTLKDGPIQFENYIGDVFIRKSDD